ncbi:hypothetical protein [Nocardia sp. NPDC051570]|uniref:hypothetical protein n=1 Tax=Nocardia sp. NPDC051570 TaxID=3364324 RepID=UPI0037BAC8E0
MDGSRASAEDRADDIPRRRLTAKVAGPAVAAGAIAVGLVLIGSCGLGHQDIYVAPPPLNADLQSAPTATRSGSTTPGIVIPPSPTWRVAVNAPPRRTLTSSSATTSPTRPPLESGESPAPTPESPRTESTDDPDAGTTTKSRPTVTPRTTSPAAPTTRSSSDTGESTISTVPTEPTAQSEAAIPAAASPTSSNGG